MATITGTSGNDKLFGTAYSDVINGLAGADTMTGGTGGDVYYVDNTGDSVVEAANGGVDTIRSSIDLSLVASFDNVEKLVLLDGALNARGNTLNNTLIGNAGENSLRGDGGNDTLVGGAGNDTYLVESLGDRIVEKAGEGTDVVIATDSYSLVPFVHVEELILKSGIAGTGNALNNTISGNGFDNILNGGTGADTMNGGDGSDTYYVDNANDVIEELDNGGIDTVISTIPLGTAFNHVENYDFSKLAVGVNFTGNELDNVIKGGAGVDTLKGSIGDDRYYLTNANDKVVELVGEGNDLLYTTFTTDLLKYANVEEAYLLGSAAINVFGNSDGNELGGNSGANILDGRGGADAMYGGKGNDTYYVDNAGDFVLEYTGGGIDHVFSSASHTLKDEVEHLTLMGFALNGTGNGSNNRIVGNELGNILDGKGGVDTMKGGEGDDTYYVDHLGDKVIENAGEGSDHVKSTVNVSLAALGNIEHVTLLGDARNATGNALSNGMMGNEFDNVLDGGANVDEMWGGKGSDIYFVDNLGDLTVEYAGEGTDTIVSTVAFNTVRANIENYDFSKVAGGVTFTGDANDNVIKGGAGIDTLIGLLGNDTYYVNSAQDKVVEAAFGGSDTVATGAFSIDLANYANVEHAKLVGAAALNATGTGITNILTGNDGANILDGKGGADFLIGGKGNDKYYVDDLSDAITEKAGEGVDTVVSSIFYHEMAVNVENLVLAAGVVNASGIGNDSKNLMIGNESDNTFDGGKNADTMKGGEGNDVYFVDEIGDKVVELANQGKDAIISTIDYSLAALGNVEVLRILDGNAIKATGNALNNRLIGNGNDNILNGGLGADEMWGGVGNDTYFMDNLNDQIVENSGEGIDTIVSTKALTNAISHVENYDFRKLSVGVNFTGSAAENKIWGGSGIDTLAGGANDDTYVVNSVKDIVTEKVGEGGDDTIVTSAFSIDLSKYANVEHATLTGSTALKATGVAVVANVLTGNTGANVLDGMGGNDLAGDTLIGGKGNDTYMVRGLNDVVTELANQGIDTVIAANHHTLAANVENLKLVAPSGGFPGELNASGTGNELNNVITGNAFENTLDGKQGADTLTGGKGNDTYLVDSASDKIIELALEGHDQVIATSDFSLAALVNVEDLFLDNLVVKGTGNNLDNHIGGNWANNILDGGKGADTLQGSTGFDQYYLDNLKDVVIEDFNGGETDTVYSTVALTHAFANVEHYDFTKATLAVNFTGSDENNLIWSSQFADTLTGGKGLDVYFINNTNDKVVELVGEGYDTVYSSANITKLWDNVERVFHQKSSSTVAWNVTGNDQNNEIHGNAGNNIFNGGKGDDIIFGEAGNDVLTGGEGADTFGYQTFSATLSGHDIITDLDGSKDVLGFWMTGDADGDGNWGEYEDVVSGVVDLGAGKNVVAHLTDGGSITFVGCGTGTVDHLADLVADPATQLHIVG